MITIAEGEVKNFFYPVLPAVRFGNTDPFLTAGASFGDGNPVKSVGNVSTRSDIQTVSEGGPVRAVVLNRDGSVVGSNAAGGQVSIAAEKRGELVPFNTTPKPLASVQPADAQQKPLDLKTLAWIAGVTVAIGVYLLL